MINMLRCMIIGFLASSLVQAQETQGTPGVDYPNYATIPSSSFKCSDQEFIPGFYADLEAQCQAYHYCSEEGQETFLCPIGTIFNQAKLACDVWYNSNCTLAAQFYSSNSGVLLENAIKSVPLLIKLRNRAKNKLSFRVPATDLNEKMSPYDGSELDQSNTKISSIANDVSAENPDTNEDQEEQLNDGESLDDILSRLEASIQNDPSVDGIYYDGKGDLNGGASDNMQTNLFFDPVTEKYYVDPESSQNEWSPNSEDDQFDFYDRENFAYKYGLAMQDAEESRDFVESTNEPVDFNGLNMNIDEVVGDQLLKRRMNIEQSFRRLRRKPIYTVDQDELPVGTRDSAVDSEVTTESISVVTDSSRTPVEITTESRRVTNTRAPFEMIEDLSQLSMTPLNITEVPMTSEEFEDAIISELIAPKIDEHDLPIIGSSWGHEQSEEYTDSSSSDIQNDGFYRYVENERPEQFAYPDVYDAETNSGTSDQIDDTAEYYQDEEGVDMSSEKSDDTFVVIPDESEIPEFSEAFDTPVGSAESTFEDLTDENVDEDTAAPDSFDFNIPTNYKPQDEYSVSDPSHYRTARYSPSVDEYGQSQYFQQEYYNPEKEASSYPYGHAEESYLTDDARSMGSEHQYSFEAQDPTSQYMYASPASYACQRQGYVDCMYGTQSSYPYGGYYHNPYVNFPYGVSEVEESSESPLSDELSYSSESPMSYIVQNDPNVNNEQFEIDQDFEHPNSYQNLNLDASDYPGEESPPDSTGAILENDAVNQETYYVLEDEDDASTSEVDPESASEPSSLDNMESVSDATGNQDETYYILDDENEEKAMEDGAEVETFTDVLENEEVHEKTSLQDNSNREESSYQEDSAKGLSSQIVDSKDLSLSEENSALGGDGAESVFGSTMDSRFTHVTTDGSFTTKNDRNGDFLLDSSERFSPNDETSRVFISSHGNLPNMFLNNMAYSDPTNFGPHGFGSSLGQPMTGGSPTSFSFANGLKHNSDSASPNVSKLSALQERIRSLKQGKFGAFKKYVSSSGSKL